jgi:hypothetical protein
VFSNRTAPYRLRQAQSEQRRSHSAAQASVLE